MSNNNQNFVDLRLRKKKILFRNLKSTNQGFILLISFDCPYIFLEKILFELFKNHYPNVINYHIQYINTEKQIISFDDLKNENLYYIFISEKYQKKKNIKQESISLSFQEILKNDFITILNEKEYQKSLELTRVLTIVNRNLKKNFFIKNLLRKIELIQLKML